MTSRALHPNIFEQPFVVHGESDFVVVRFLIPIGAQPKRVHDQGYGRYAV
jgi:hypothetical protein